MTFSCSEQIGGFNNIEVYTLDECDTWPLLLTDHTADQITFNPDLTSIDGRIIPESIRVNERHKKTKSGRHFEVSISFDFASQSPALEQVLDQYKAIPVVVIACKNFPQKKIYGSNKNPLQINYELVNGRRPEDGSLTKVTISGITARRGAHILTEPVL